VYSPRDSRSSCRSRRCKAAAAAAATDSARSRTGAYPPTVTSRNFCIHAASRSPACRVLCHLDNSASALLRKVEYAHTNRRVCQTATAFLLTHSSFICAQPDTFFSFQAPLIWCTYPNHGSDGGVRGASAVSARSEAARNHKDQDRRHHVQVCRQCSGMRDMRSSSHFA
jgi:hypothetical protein